MKATLFFLIGLLTMTAIVGINNYLNPMIQRVEIEKWPEPNPEGDTSHYSKNHKWYVYDRYTCTYIKDCTEEDKSQFSKCEIVSMAYSLREGTGLTEDSAQRLYDKYMKWLRNH